jgi:hypothetical protein
MTETRGISRGTLVALLAGLILVGLVLFGAAFLYVGMPSPSTPDAAADRGDIRGSWRADTVPDCTSKRRLIITDNRIIGKGPDGQEASMAFDVQIVKFSETSSPALILRVPGESPALTWVLTTDLNAGELRFVSIEWSELSRAMFGKQLDKLPSASVVLDTLQRRQPFHRCP